MKSTTTRLLTIILALAMLTLAACANDVQPISSSKESTELVLPAEQSASPSSIDEPSESDLTYYMDAKNWPERPDIDGAPVLDLTDLKRLTEVYVWPLTINGGVWSESWSSPSEIPANILIYICSFNEWVEYDASDTTVQPFAPAGEVEAALQKHFDVSSDYLRASTSYNADNNTYPMIDGGGGWGAFAMGAEHEGGRVTIKVGSIGPDETIPTPMGTLLVELEDGNVVKYLSYSVIDSSESNESAETVLTEFTVDIYPPLGVQFPAESAPQRESFTLELPVGWVSVPTDETSNQYIFNTKDMDDDAYIALIQGGRQPEDPTNPFALALQDASQEDLNSGAVQAIDILDYPVLRYTYPIQRHDIYLQNTVYYIYVNGGLIEMQFTAYETIPISLEKQLDICTEVVCSFSLVSTETRENGERVEKTGNDVQVT